MDLTLSRELAENYKSRSQIARVITEDWTGRNMYCPRCGYAHIVHAPNNSRVEDFYCPECSSEFELKSKSKPFGEKITDGEYKTMLERINSRTAPDFFFLTYNLDLFSVMSFTIVTKEFLSNDIIEKRRPLGPSARRAGWVGCNILVERIPSQGKLGVIKNSQIVSTKSEIVKAVKRSSRLNGTEIGNRSWLGDVLSCVNDINGDTFTIGEVYEYKERLSLLHPDNHNVEAKIRQQLQVLRDKGFIKFVSPGVYCKLID